MKRCLIIIAFALATNFLFANPPSFGTIGYDNSTQLLTVKISHNIMTTPIKDPAKHFVKEVVINVNGIRVLIQDYTSQEDAKGLAIVSRLILKRGDKVVVTAFCSVSGEASTNYYIP